MSQAKPRNIHKLKGTYQPCRHGADDEVLDFDDVMPEAPACLDTEAKIEWIRICKVFKGKKVLTEGDRAMLTAYCQIWSKLAGDPQEFKANDYAQLRGLCGDLGLSPISRSKLRLKSAEKKKKTGFEDF